MSKTSKFRPYLAAAVVNISTLSVGLSVGWMSPAASILQSDSPSLGDNRPLNDDIVNWMGSLLFLGSVVGVFFWGIITQKHGRKIAGYLMAVPLIVGWMALLFGPNHMWLLVGRFIMGISVTGVAIIPPLYANEISEDSYRGTTGSFIVMFFTFGIFVAYSFGAILSITESIIFCILVTVLFVLLFYFLPESPVYLWTKGKKKEAESSLTWLRSGNYAQVEKEISMFELILKNDVSKSRVSYNKLYENKGTIKAMIIGLVLFASQHFCGRAMLLVYTTVILQKSNMHLSHNTGTVVVGTTQFLSCVLSSFIIDRINRKTLLVISFCGMSISLFIIGLFFYLLNYSESPLLPNETPMIFICVHSIFYYLSASMPYVISGETLKPDIRPLAFSVLIFWGAVLSFICLKIYNVLVHYVGMHGNFWFFSLYCLLVAIFALFCIPETRGKSLIEILNKLNGEPVVNQNNESDLRDNPIEILKNPVVDTLNDNPIEILKKV